MSAYRVYFQNADLYRTTYEYLYAGATNFFYTQEVDHEKFIDNLNRIRVFFQHETCEISQDRGDHVWRIRPGQQNAAPVWRMETGSLEELEEILETKPETIFIEYFKGYVRGPAFLHIHGRAAKLKHFLEIKYAHPDIEFIAFGSFMFRFFFQMSMDGGAIRPRTYKEHASYQNDYFKIAPDGQRIQYSPLRKALSIAARYRAAQIMKATGKRVHINTLRSIMMLLATPNYQEQVRGIELEQEYDAVKYLPDEFFPEDVDRPTKLLPRKIPLLSQALPGDKIMCDSCSLKYRCPVYKPESVCIVSESDGKVLADYFNSRSADDVLNGLQAVLSKQAERVEGAVEQEEEAQKTARDAGEPVIYSDQVTKMLDGLQKNADKFLRLVDPRFTKPVVQINNNAIPSGPTPREIDPAAAREELVELGMPREAITAEHIERYLSGSWNGPNEMQALGSRTIDGEIGF